MLDFALIRFGPLCFDQTVRIMLRREENKSRFLRIRNYRECLLESPPRRMAPGIITIKGEDNLGHDLKKLPDVRFTDCRAKCRHGFAKPSLRELNHVHIAFAHNGAASLADRFPSLPQTIDFLTFLEDIGFRTVQILRFSFSNHPSAKTNHLPSRITDREHHTAAETVIAVTVFRDRKAAVLQRF